MRRLLLFSTAALLALPLLAVAAALGAGAWIERSAEPWVHASIEDVPSRDVVIVLGARVLPDGTVSGPLEDRLHTALELYRADAVQWVLVSGDNGRPGYDEVNAMQRWLVDRGVPVERIYLDHAGFRTFDTMERARRVFDVDSAIVSTQGFHVHRSVFLARQAGIDAVGVSADRRAYPLAARDHRRERLARTRAALDTLNPLARPRHLGPPIPVSASAAHLSHDRNSAR